MNSVQTDNSHFEAKVKLRIDNLPPGGLQVLDLFAGDGQIWGAIRKRCKGRKIQILRIDQKRDKPGIYLAGDNRKFLPHLDLDRFNIIDLDAYGVPYEQLKILFARQYEKPLTVFVTFIQTEYAGLPYKFLSELAYSLKMVRKCPTLFKRDGFGKLKQYLALSGVKYIKYFSDAPGRKFYVWFQLGPGDKTKAR